MKGGCTIRLWVLPMLSIRFKYHDPIILGQIHSLQRGIFSKFLMLFFEVVILN